MTYDYDSDFDEGLPIEEEEFDPESRIIYEAVEAGHCPECGENAHLNDDAVCPVCHKQWPL